MKRILLCAMVKNEEKILENTLNAWKPFVDGMLILDTGSTDGTIEIAQKFGVVYQKPFVNFTKSKNDMLDLADLETDYDYVIVSDADELPVTGLEHLRDYIEKDADAISCLIIEGQVNAPVMEYQRFRMWKLRKGFRFVGPNVHEVIDVAGNLYYSNQIKVHHNHAHRTPESYSQRNKLYVEQLTSYLEENPDNPRAMFYLARTYRDMTEKLFAIEWYEKYLQSNSTFRDERWQAQYDVALCWKELGEYEYAFQACDACEYIDPRRCEQDVLKGIMEFELQRFDVALNHFAQALKKPKPNDVMLFLNSTFYHMVPLEYAAICEYRLKNFRNSLNMYRELLKQSPLDQRLISNVALLNKQASLKIFFMLGDTPEPVYGNMFEETGVGGVESAFLELSEAMQSLGHECFVFSKCKQQHIHNAVRFIPYTQYDKFINLAPDIVITSRWFDSLKSFPKAKKVAWLQDAYFSWPADEDLKSIIDLFVCSSQWHRTYIAERFGTTVNADKIKIISLGLDPKKIAHGYNSPKVNGKVIYTSNPDRGLYILKDMWNEICEAVPWITLTITYGWEGLLTWNQDQAWKQKIEHDKHVLNTWAQNSGNVTFTGRLKKADLYKEIASSVLCLYPNNFPETYCLSAAECQALKTPMITTAMGALTTTLDERYNVLIKGNPFSLEYQNAFIENTIKYLKNSEELITKGNALITRWSDVAVTWERALYKCL